MAGFKHWVEYLEETHDSFVVELEHGFATYSFIEPNGGNKPAQIYLKELYVHPDHRKSGLASQLVDMVADIGREYDCYRLIGSCAPSNKGSTESLKAILAYGMQLLSVENGVIYVYKDL